MTASHDDVLVVILGGGQGKRLFPLTRNRAKPAVSFGGKYRLIDIPITNCLHSDFNQIFILTQFNSFSLNRHIWQSYSQEISRGGFIDVVAAEQTIARGDWFQGTADAVRQTMQYILYHKPKYVLILSGDQVYSMDYGELLSWHREHDAQITIAANYSHPDRLHGLGVVKVNKDAAVLDFYEKPKSVDEVAAYRLGASSGCPEDRPYLASMGIYLFNTEILEKALDNAEIDFGKGVIPLAAQQYAMSCFPFDGYWEDVGTIPAFFDANMEWRIGGGISEMYHAGSSIVTHSRQLPPTRVMGTRIEDCLIADGCLLSADSIARSIIGVRTRVNTGTHIEDSIVMGNDTNRENGRPEIGRDCTIRRAITDKNVILGDGCKIVNKDNRDDYDDPEERYVIRSGIVVLPQETVLEPGTII